MAPRAAPSAYRTFVAPPDGIDLRVPYRLVGSILGDEELEAIKRVVDSGRLSNGPETPRFEEEFATYHQVHAAFAVTNCTSALHIAAQLCRLGPGDEVITSPTTFIVTNQAVLATGAMPVFADVDARTFNIDPASVREKITSRTRAIFVTHIAGQMCDMDAIEEIAREHDLLVVEDCAHAAGATYKDRFAGAVGDVGCFSFHSIKNMTTLGEGGMVTTQRDELALKVPWLRSKGCRYPNDRFDDGTPGPRPYDIDDVDGVVPGNVRMTEVQAAVGRAQLARLPGMLARRREIAGAWSVAFSDLPGVTPPYVLPGCRHSFHIYALTIDPDVAGLTAAELADTLLYDHGVQTFPGLYRPSYLFSLYRKRGLEPGLCPVAERIAESTLQLPISPALDDGDVAYVVDAVRKACASA